MCRRASELRIIKTIVLQECLACFVARTAAASCIAPGSCWALYANAAHCSNYFGGVIGCVSKGSHGLFLVALFCVFCLCIDGYVGGVFALRCCYQDESWLTADQFAGAGMCLATWLYLIAACL